MTCTHAEEDTEDYGNPGYFLLLLFHTKLSLNMSENPNGCRKGCIAQKHCFDRSFFAIDLTLNMTDHFRCRPFIKSWKWKYDVVQEYIAFTLSEALNPNCSYKALCITHRVSWTCCLLRLCTVLVVQALQVDKNKSFHSWSAFVQCRWTNQYAKKCGQH